VDAEEEWAPGESRNIAHFFRALRREWDAAWPVRGKQVLTRQEVMTYCSGLAGALEEAAMLEKDVMDKVHPDLAGAVQGKYVAFLRLASQGARSGVIPRDAAALSKEWHAWWSANGKDLRFPDEVPVRRDEGLTDEWGREFRGVRFPRFMPE
jgi:hypothetical protein